MCTGMGTLELWKAHHTNCLCKGGASIYVNFLQLMLHILFNLVWYNWFISVGNYWHLHVYLISTKFHSKWIHCCQAVGHSAMLSYTLAYDYLVDSSIHMMRVRNNQCFDWPRPSFTGWIIMWNFSDPLAWMCPQACMSHHIQSYPASLGLYSLSGKTSYRQIWWSLEAARLDVAMVVSLWSLTGTSAAALPRYLTNFRAIGKV